MITGIISVSGGAGASTLTAYVAKILAASGKKVLVVDLNQMNDCSRLLSLKTQNGLDKISNDFQLTQLIDNTQSINIDVITTLNRNLNFEKLYEKLIQVDFFEQLSQLLEQGYDHVLIDCGAQFNSMMKSAIKVCDKLLAVINAKPQAVNAVVPVLDKISKLRINNPLISIKFILNQVNVQDIGCKIAISQYNKILIQDIKFSSHINRFTYALKNKKVFVILPIKAYRLMAQYINHKLEKSQALETISVADLSPIQAKVYQLVQLIHQGTASSETDLLDEMSYEENTLDLDSISVEGSDITQNLDELFRFIRSHKLGQSALIVDEEGLPIAEYGDNSQTEIWAANISQYVQMLMFAESQAKANGFWVEEEGFRIFMMAIEVDDNFYSILIKCQEVLSTKHAKEVSKLLAKIIQKGIKYE